MWLQFCRGALQVLPLETIELIFDHELDVWDPILRNIIRSTCYPEIDDRVWFTIVSITSEDDDLSSFLWETLAEFKDVRDYSKTVAQYLALTDEQVKRNGVERVSHLLREAHRRNVDFLPWFDHDMVLQDAQNAYRMSSTSAKRKRVG